jgi:hypothetical protein
MPHQLTFTISENYPSTRSGITIRAVLSLKDVQISCEAKVDPGAQVCLFKRELGEELGINVENGYPIVLDSLGGPLKAFGHSVTLHTLGLEFDSVVYFAEQYNLRRNLLGREGWLAKVRMAVIDYDSMLYLSAYDDQP